LTPAPRYVKLAPEIRINWSFRLVVGSETAISISAFGENS